MTALWLACVLRVWTTCDLTHGLPCRPNTWAFRELLRGQLLDVGVFLNGEMRGIVLQKDFRDLIRYFPLMVISWMIGALLLSLIAGSRAIGMPTTFVGNESRRVSTPCPPITSKIAGPVRNTLPEVTRGAESSGRHCCARGIVFLKGALGKRVNRYLAVRPGKRGWQGVSSGAAVI